MLRYRDRKTDVIDVMFEPLDWGLAWTQSKKLSGKDYSLVEAYLEGEAIDSETEERLGTTVATTLGPYLFGPGKKA